MTKEQIQTLTDVFMRCCTHANWPTIYVQDTPYSVATIEKMLDSYGIKYRKENPRTIKFENFYLDGSTNLPYEEIPLVIDEKNISDNLFEVSRIVRPLELRLKVITNLVAAHYQEDQKNKKRQIKKSTEEVRKKQKNPRQNTVVSERE